jgi:two-component system alkaline phosphatase synthesis response regulator PhoP
MAEILVLIVDDYRDALDLWEWYLRSRGFRVLTATNGADAVQLAKTVHPDVVVMDLQLPRLNGCDAARLLRATPETKHIPLIAATGFSHDRQLDEARAAGFDRIVVKPCDPARLVDEIQETIAGHRGSRPR